MQKKQPERTCIVCRKKGTKDNFIKIVLNKSGNLAIERDKKLDGRGAYICASEECILKCKKAKSINRVFKKNVEDEFYEELKNEFENRQN